MSTRLDLVSFLTLSYSVKLSSVDTQGEECDLSQAKALP